MYEKLLLTAGGGIIDQMQQSEQDDCAVLAIGLGGTGIDCLRTLKRKVYSRIKPDDSSAVVPRYSHIKYLAVDTDMQAMKKSASAEGADGSLGQIEVPGEFFDISYPNSISELFEKNRKLLAKDPAYREWLRFDHIKSGVADDGAGGVRQLGRFLLMNKASEFVNQIENLATQAKSGLSATARVYVHIFAGIGGGTGSGTFLDTCYLVQHALSERGFEARVLGYFFLPDVNLSKSELPKEVRDYVMDNGYAAMQELDYCMNFESNGDRWHQTYPGVGEVESRKQPVSLCHLVSATTSDGKVFPEAYDYAMNAVTDYVMDFMVRPSEDEFSLNSHLSNVSQGKRFVNKNSGAVYDYLVLGASSAVVPYKEMLTYLASQVFANFGSVRQRVPSNDESQLFCNTLGYRFDAVLQRVLQGVDISFPVPDDVKAKDAKDNEQLVIAWFHDMQSHAEGMLRRNYEALSAGLGTYAPVSTGTMSAVQSLPGLILSAVRDAMVDPNRGPWWAAAMVRGLGGSDLLAMTAGIREEAMSRRDHEQFQIDNHLFRTYQQKQRAFEAAGLFTRGAAYKEWVNATRNLVVTQTQVTVYQTMVNLMDAVRDELTRMADRFTDPFARMVGELTDTFRENAAQLSTFTDDENPYEVPLIDMKTMLPQLNRAVMAMNMPMEMNRLLQMLVSEQGMRGWGPDGDAGLLCQQVIMHFTTVFSMFSNRTITDFLMDKFGTDVPDKLATAVYNVLLQPANTNAAPLFWTETGYTISDAVSIGYLTVPQTAPVLINAAEKLKQADTSLSIRTTSVLDRISILRCLAGVPMWGYKGVKQYEKESGSGMRHLYQGAEYVEGVSDENETKRARNWSLLPSPTPLSHMNGSNAGGVVQRAEAAADLYEKVSNKGIIAKSGDGGSYLLRTLSEPFMQRFRTEFDAAKDKPNDAKLEAKARLEAMASNRECDPTVHTVVALTGNETASEHDIVVDCFADAPTLQEIARRELERCREIEDDIAALEPKRDVDFEEFSNALFTGVIRLAIPMITFTDDQWGEEEQLSVPKMQYGGTPLYQAYVSFKALSADKRESINNAVQAVLEQDMLPDEATEACRLLHAELGKVRRQAYIKMANMKYPHETADVKQLLTGLSDALEMYAMTYAIALD